MRYWLKCDRRVFFSGHVSGILLISVSISAQGLLSRYGRDLSSRRHWWAVFVDAATVAPAVKNFFFLKASSAWSISFGVRTEISFRMHMTS